MWSVTLDPHQARGFKGNPLSSPIRITVKFLSTKLNNVTGHQGRNTRKRGRRNRTDNWYGTWTGAAYTAHWYKICWCWLHIHRRWRWGQHIWWTNCQDINTRGGSIKMLAVPSSKTLAHPIKSKHNQPQYWHLTMKQSWWTKNKQSHIFCLIKSNNSLKKHSWKNTPVHGKQSTTSMNSQ